MKWIPANEHLTKEWNSRTIARFIHTKLVIHELRHFLEKYPDRINTVEILDESPSPVEVVDYKKELEFAMAECKRLADVAEYWHKEYLDQNPGWQPAKLDNL